LHATIAGQLTGKIGSALNGINATEGIRAAAALQDRLFLQHCNLCLHFGTNKEQ
jgi:hypothetical protein